MDDLETDGYALADVVLARHQCEHMAASLPAVAGAGRGGLRHLISHPIVLRLLGHGQLGKFIWSVTGRELVAVNATLFDKTPAANWRVQWHQDRAIPVKDRFDVTGYGPWSTKAGVLHVEAPSEVLAQMLAIRIHIDDCAADNGPIRAIRGSHRSGKVPEEQLDRVVAEGTVVELCAAQGAILVMRPLLVHTSSSAPSPQHRRVLHIELAPPEAITPLQWHSAVQLRRTA